MSEALAASQPGPLGRALRAYPTLLKVSFSDMTAYRAEIIIWFLTASLPIIMMLVWDKVAEAGAVGRYDRPGFAGYFTVNLCVRQLTGAWIVWELNQLIRSGGLSPMLLKPVHPLAFLTSQSLAEKPFRALALIPLVVALVLWRPEMRVAPGVAEAALGVLAVGLAWAINTAVQVCFATLAFWLDQSTGLYTVWFGLWALLSGYLFPLELLPGWARTVVELLPFRCTLGAPVELLTGATTGAAAGGLVLLQLAWLTFFVVLAGALWRRGVGHYEAYGA